MVCGGGVRWRMVVYSGVGILRWCTVVRGGDRWCTVVHVGVWVVVVYGGARVRWCAAVYDGARSAVVCGGVKRCMAVYVAKKIILYHFLFMSLACRPSIISEKRGALIPDLIF